MPDKKKFGIRNENSTKIIGHSDFVPSSGLLCENGSVYWKNTKLFDTSWKQTTQDCKITRRDIYTFIRSWGKYSRLKIKQKDTREQDSSYWAWKQPWINTRFLERVRVWVNILQVFFTDCIHVERVFSRSNFTLGWLGGFFIIGLAAGAAGVRWGFRGHTEAEGRRLRRVGAHKVPISCPAPPVNCPLSPETHACFFLGQFCQLPISLLSSDQLDLTEGLFKANNFYSNNVHAFNFLADSSTKI